MANTQEITLTQEKLAQIVAAAVQAAMAGDALKPALEPEPATTKRKPRQTKKANRMACKWQTIEGLEVVTLQRHTYNVELMDSARVKRMVSNEVKDCRKQGIQPTKILMDGTWAFVKLPNTVTRKQAQFDLHAIENWCYSKKEHAFYRDFAPKKKS